MTKMIISNDKGFQFDNYNITLLRKLGNITYYYLFYFIYEIIIRVTPRSS